MKKSSIRIPHASARPRRILFISQVYSPSHDAISQINADLAVGLRDLGWEVHVLTNQVNYMTGERLQRHEVIDGIRVWRTPCVPLQREHPLARTAIYGGFLVASGPATALIPKPDVAVYLSTPPLCGWSASMLRRFGGVKTVYWAQDVYPEVAVQMGVLKNPFIRWSLFVVDRNIARGMDEIVVIGDEMGRVFEKKGVASARITTISNWSVAAVEPVSRARNPLLAEHGLLDKFVVQYSGNMGVVHDLTPICEAMVKTAGIADIHWLMIGDGRRRGEVEKAVQEHGLSNVTMLPYQPFDALSVSLSAADAALVSLWPAMEGLVVPSKLYGAMAAGRPILFVGSLEGEVVRIIERHECGYAASDGDSLARAVTLLKNDAKLRRQMGENARHAYDECYARKHAVRKFDDLLTRLVCE